MQVVNLPAWAGDDFSYAPGQVIDLPADVALARIDAGLAAPVMPPAPAEDAPAKRGQGRPRKVST